MLYTKKTLRNGKTVKNEIRSDNLFATCSRCGKELSIDPVDLITDDGTLFDCFVCPECSPQDIGEGALSDDDIIHIAVTVCWLGYLNRLMELYEEFGITVLQDLKQQDRKDFVRHLLSGKKREDTPVSDNDAFDENAAFIDSREAAKLLGTPHDKIIRDIRTILNHKFGFDDEFRRSNFKLYSFVDSSGIRRPRYLLAQDGYAALERMGTAR